MCSDSISENYVLSPQSVFLKGTLRVVFGNPSENGRKQEFRLSDETHTSCMQRVTGLGVSLAGTLKWG